MHILHLKASGLPWASVLEVAIPPRQLKILDKIKANYEKQIEENNS